MRVRLKLAAKFMIATAGTVALLMLVFGGWMAHSLSMDAQKQADEKASDETNAILNSLTIANALSSQNVHVGMRIMIQEGEALEKPALKGTAALDGKPVPDLTLNGKSQVGNYALVDQVKDLTGNAATLFVRRGNDFLRISTNVQKLDGSRAVGTLLDPAGRPYAALQSGQAFYGVADILGLPYMTGYEPLRDSSNQVIGAWFVGVPLSALADLGRHITNARILDNGYLALLKSDGGVSFRPDRVSAEEIQKRVHNSGDGSWVVRTASFDPWGYTLLAAYPAADVAALQRRAQLLLALAVVLTTLLLTVVEYVAMSRLVLAPTNEALEQAEAIAQCDLTGRDIQVRSEDELGELARAINRMKVELAEMVTSIAQDAEKVAHASEGFTSVSQEITANSAQTSEQAKVVSAATDQINRNLQTVASSTEEMSASIGEIAKNASTAAKIAAEALRAATATHSTVSKLGESSAQIGAVVKVITSIAEQTNLLALNATIEAARAGEAGKGFSVVAGEVKELAKQTAHATQDIGQRIAAIQVDAQGAVAAIKTIDGIITRMSEISATIASAVEEQAATTTEMSRNATEAAHGALEVARNIAQVARASQDTMRGAAGSQQAAQELARMSTGLRELIHQFKVDRNGSDGRVAA